MEDQRYEVALPAYVEDQLSSKLLNNSFVSLELAGLLSVKQNALGIVIYSEAAPVLKFTNGEDYSSFFWISFQKSKVSEKLPFPFINYASFSLKSADHISSSVKIGYQRFLAVKKLAKLTIDESGKDYTVDYQFYDERDPKIGVFMDIRIELGLQIELAEDKHIVVYWSEVDNCYVIASGTKSFLQESSLTTSLWLRNDNYINWKQSSI